MVAWVAVEAVALDPTGLRQAMLDPRAGAVVVFEGCARDHHDGKAVTLLAYEAFVPMAMAELEKLREEAISTFSLIRCAIHHRLGEVPLLEPAVIVACASPHRQEAFAAAAWIMDRIKERVPIWKQEHYTAGPSSWIEATARHPR